MSPKKKVLFVCVANSCRSQMAEGWARQLRTDIHPYSAGTRPGLMVDPRAIRVMAEVGVDISLQQPKAMSAVHTVPFDLIITLCSNAEKECPFFPAPAKTMHVPFDDPAGLTFGMENEHDILVIYRRVRDEIRAFIEKLAV